MSDRRTWFRAKRYGWGWGVPARREGWWVVAAYVLAVTVGTLVALVADAWLWSAGITLGATILLVFVCWRTGEPPRWRWGDDE